MTKRPCQGRPKRASSRQDRGVRGRLSKQKWDAWSHDGATKRCAKPIRDRCRLVCGRGGALSVGDPSDRVASRVSQTPGVSIENHLGEAEAVVASVGCDVERPFELHSKIAPLLCPCKHPQAQDAQETIPFVLPQYHDRPKGHITMMHRSAAAPSGMKAPCALCHEIGAYSAACTTAKSETKKCLMIGFRVSFRIHVPCLCGSYALPFGKRRCLQKFSLDAPRDTLSSAGWSFHSAACRGFQSLCPCCHNPTTSSLKVIRRTLHPPLLMGCSRDFTLSSKHCIIAGILERRLLVPSLVQPASSTGGVPLAPLLSSALRQVAH